MLRTPWLRVNPNCKLLPRPNIRQILLLVFIQMSSLRVLSKDQVDLLLQRSSDPNVSPELEIINLMAETFTAYSFQPEKVQSPHRITVQTPNHTVLYMPSRVDGMGTAMKVVSVPKNGKGGLPSNILVMDEETGNLRAVVNAAALTAIRTAAGKWANKL
jgi:ornithine cyclodeaminase